MTSFYYDVLREHTNLHNVICKRENTSSGKIKYPIDINFFNGSIILVSTVKSIMVLDMSTGNQGVSASSPLIVNTASLLNSYNLKEMSKKSTLDAFNESMDDGSGGEQILVADGTEKISVMNDILH